MLFLTAKFTPVEIIPHALFATAFFYTLLSLYSWRKRPALTAVPFTGLMLAMAWWSLGYGLEIEYPNLVNKIFLAKLQYPGIVAIPVLWFEFALEYTRREAFLTRRNQILLWVIPFIIIILAWTNELHHLIWTATSLAQINNLIFLHLEHGPAFWISVVYNYLLILVGSWILILGAWQASRLYRAQAISILAAVLCPIVGNIIYLTGLLPDLGVDLTIFLFIPTSLILAWGIARYRLLNIIPPAQAAILRNLHDGVLVVDAFHQVLYMNRAAEEIFSKSANESLGQPIDLICASYSAKILPLLGGTEKSIELTLSVKGLPHQYEIHTSSIYSTDGPSLSERPSYLIVFHNITKQKAAESALARREAILKAVSAASEYFLKASTLEKNVPVVLEQLGRATQVSRVYVFERHSSDADAPRVSQRYEWVDGNISPQINNPDLQNISLREIGYARWEEAFKQHRSIFGLVREFPESEREILFAQGIQAIAVVPIFADEKLWGFIGFDECNYEREWDEAELNALRTAADIFGAALMRHSNQTRLLKRQRTLDLLQEILQATLSHSNLYEMSQFLVDHLGNLIGADGCFLTLWDDYKNQVIPLAAYGEFRNIYHTMKPQPGEKSFTASALEAGQTLIIDNAVDSPHISQHIARQFPTVSALVLPMISNEKKLGAVLLGFNHQHSFNQEEIIISEQATNLVTLAVAKFQALEQARRHAEESETLRKAGATVAETLEMKEATTRILQQLAHVLPHDSASVQLLRNGELEIIGEEGFKSAVVGMRFPVPGNNPNTVVMETRQPYLLHDADMVYPVFQQSPHDHIRSWLGVPLIVHDQLIGLLAIDSNNPHHFTPENIELVSTFANQVAIAIENARLFNEVQHLAITDSLTGLYNRRHFLDLAQVEFERARRYKRYLTMMIFDIDHFKNFNDTYGHQIGDKVLQAIAELCREKIREVDPFGRYGGEEFIALLIESDVGNAKKTAERFRVEVEKLVVETEKGNLKVTISIGLAQQTQDTPDLDTLIARADQALYTAKHKGRNRVVVSK